MDPEDKKLANANMDIDYPEGAGEETPNSESQPEKEQGQGQSQTPPVISPTEEKKEEVKKPAADDSGIEDKTPFHEDPTFKKRLEQEREKGRQEQWSYIVSIAEKRPTLALELIAEMEEQGQVKSGTYAQAKDKLQAQLAEEEKKKNLNNNQKQDQEPSKEEDFKKAINEHPDVKYAREQREKQEKIAEEQKQSQEKYFQDFDTKHPEIEKSKDPVFTRGQIGAKAYDLVLKGKYKYEDWDLAMEEAADWILDEDKMLNKYKEKGLIEARVRSNQENLSGASLAGDGNSSSKTDSISEEDKKAAKLAGMTDEEYIKYSSPNSGIVD